MWKVWETINSFAILCITVRLIMHCTVEICKHTLIFIFTVSCFTLSAYMTYLQFKDYFSNQDSTSVSHKAYTNDMDILYPTFTICFFGEHASIFNDLTKICPFPCSNETYYYVNLVSCRLACSNEEYFDTLIGVKEDNYNLSSINFDKKALELTPLIIEFHSITNEGGKLQRIQRLSLKKKGCPYSLSKENPILCCISFLHKLIICHRHILWRGVPDIVRSRWSWYMQVLTSMRGALAKSQVRKISHSQEEKTISFVNNRR